MLSEIEVMLAQLTEAAKSEEQVTRTSVARVQVSSNVVQRVTNFFLRQHNYLLFWQFSFLYFIFFGSVLFTFMWQVNLKPLFHKFGSNMITMMAFGCRVIDDEKCKLKKNLFLLGNFFLSSSHVAYRWSDHNNVNQVLYNHSFFSHRIACLHSYRMRRVSMGSRYCRENAVQAKHWRFHSRAPIHKQESGECFTSCYYFFFLFLLFVHLALNETKDAQWWWKGDVTHSCRFLSLTQFFSFFVWIWHRNKSMQELCRYTTNSCSTSWQSTRQP